MRDTLMVQRLIQMVSIIKSLLNGICVNAHCVIYVNQVGSEVKSLQGESNGFDSTFLLCLVVALSSQRSMDSGTPNCVWIRHHLY